MTEAKWKIPPIDKCPWCGVTPKKRNVLLTTDRVNIGTTNCYVYCEGCRVAGPEVNNSWGHLGPNSPTALKIAAINAWNRRQK